MRRFTYDHAVNVMGLTLGQAEDRRDHCRSAAERNSHDKEAGRRERVMVHIVNVLRAEPETADASP